ncbi:MAG: trehalose-phosphatase [Rhodospirillales bacterium]|nr:trehalose-phosphatase [Rhodospirillales bacterium]MBO6785613.1 trehalose-phosphatase [Rhodospirillales bacterium]
MNAPNPLSETKPIAAPGMMALFLDVDGTLLEFSDTPDQVDVPKSLVQSLFAARTVLGGAIALISGRALADLDRLFQPLHLPSAGLHGFEVRHSDGEHRRHDADAAAISHERDKLHQMFEAVPGVLIEDKGPCVAIHFRRAPALSGQVTEAVAAALARLGPEFEMLEGDMVRELRPAGINKGHAIRQLMERPPFAGRTPVFIGDDVTDEDGFAAVNELSGISVIVGDRRPTQAQARLDNVAAVRRWLDHVISTADPTLSPSDDRETMQA